MISRSFGNDIEENVGNQSTEIDDIIISINQEFLWKNIVEKIFFDIRKEN